MKTGAARGEKRTNEKNGRPGEWKSDATEEWIKEEFCDPNYIPWHWYLSHAPIDYLLCRESQKYFSKTVQYICKTEDFSGNKCNQKFFHSSKILLPFARSSTFLVGPVSTSVCWRNILLATFLSLKRRKLYLHIPARLLNVVLEFLVGLKSKL